MTFQKSSGVRFILLGLIVAFLHSALILPLADSPGKVSTKRDITISSSSDSHSSQNGPISLPGEEKEEENRAEKDSKFAFEVLDSTFEYSLNLQIETVSFQFDLTRTSLQSDTPLYLLKQSFLI